MLFATFITLILVPTSYMILDDVGRTMRGLFGRREPSGAEPSGAEPAGVLPAGAVPEGGVARVAEATS